MNGKKMSVLKGIKKVAKKAQQVGINLRKTRKIIFQRQKRLSRGNLKKSKYLFNTSIFITLEPCAMCAAAISKAKIEKVYFGAYDEKQGSIESIMNIYHNKNFYIPEVYGGISEKKCSKLLKDFFKTKRENIVK